MKRITTLLLSTLSLSAFAAVIEKAENTDALNLPSSWVGGVVPGASDLVMWNENVTGTIPLGGPMSISGLIATNLAGNVTFTGSDTFSIGSDGINFQGSKRNLTVNPPMAATSDGVWSINGGGAMTFNSAISYNGHTITFSGSNNKEVKSTGIGPGTAEVVAGTLKVSNGASAPDVDGVVCKNAQIQFNQTPAANGAYRLKSVTLRGVEHYDGAIINSSGRKNENGDDKISGALTIDSGYGIVHVVPNAERHQTLTFGSFEMTPFGFVNFRGTNLGLTPMADLVPNAASVAFATAPALVGGIGTAGTATLPILPNALVSTNTGDMGYTFGTYDSVYGVRPLDLETEYAAVLPDGQDTLENVRLCSDGSQTQVVHELASAFTAINSLTLNVDAATAGGIVIRSNDGTLRTLRLASGMLYARQLREKADTSANDAILIDGSVALDFNGNAGSIINRQSYQENMGSKNNMCTISAALRNDGGNGINFFSAQNRGLVYLYGNPDSDYTGPVRLFEGNLRLHNSPSAGSNTAITGDIEIYNGTCQNPGNCLPDTSDIRIYGGSFLQKGGASNSGSGAPETFRDLTISGGGMTSGASGTSSGSTTMRNGMLLGGTWTQTRGHKITAERFTFAGGVLTINQDESSGRTTILTLNDGISITNTPSGAYTPIVFSAGADSGKIGALMKLSGGLEFIGNPSNDATAVIANAAPAANSQWAHIQFNGVQTFDIGDGAAAIDLRVEPWLQDLGTTPGGIRKTGAGTLALVHTNNAYTAGTFVDAGTLVADGALAGDVAVASGAAFQGGLRGDTGSLALAGDLTLASGAHLVADVAADGALQTVVAGDVLASGTVVVDAVYAEDANETLEYKVLTATSIQGGSFLPANPKLAAWTKKNGTELWIGPRRGTLIILQ